MIEFSMILTQIPQRTVPANDNLTLTGGNQACENFDKGGFSRSIGSDEAITVAGRKLDADVLKQNIRPESLG